MSASDTGVSRLPQTLSDDFLRDVERLFSSHPSFVQGLKNDPCNATWGLHFQRYADETISPETVVRHLRSGNPDDLLQIAQDILSRKELHDRWLEECVRSRQG